MKKPSGATKNSDAKLAVKKTAAKGKAAKDPNVKSVAQVRKAGGAKWKAMSDSDKAPYKTEAEKRKKENEKSTSLYETDAMMQHETGIREELSERALVLLALPKVQKLLLVIVCGSGLSGETISEKGHKWIGLDISRLLPDVALERETDGDLILGDIGQGLGIPLGGIDGAISISAVQWLCTADKSCDEQQLRLKAFFRSVYRCLGTGARAVFTLYPKTDAQRELILRLAFSAGFVGGVVTDHPDSKKRKEYLVLTPGPSKNALPKAKGENKEKEQMSNKGNVMPRDTKYTARKRKARF